MSWLSSTTCSTPSWEPELGQQMETRRITDVEVHQSKIRMPTMAQTQESAWLGIATLRHQIAVMGMTQMNIANPNHKPPARDRVLGVDSLAHSSRGTLGDIRRTHLAFFLDPVASLG